MTDGFAPTTAPAPDPQPAAPDPSPAPQHFPSLRFFRYQDVAGRGRHQAVLITGSDEDGALRGYVLGHLEDAARFLPDQVTTAPARQEGDR